jgi:hypothetical protein
MKTIENETINSTEVENTSAANLADAMQDATGELSHEDLSNTPAEEVLAAAGGPPKKGRFEFDASAVASTRKGTKVRSNIFYEVIGVPSSSTKMQPQKALCLQLVNDNTSDDKPRISEPELKAIVEAAKADGTLETKQDAWRIFAYYKGQLVEEGFLAEHKEPTKKSA